MSSRRVLGQLAHCRAGDKGDDSLLVVVPFDSSDFDEVVKALEDASIAESFGVASSSVEIRPAPQLRAIVVCIRSCLGGGVTRSTRIDPHGKSLSSRLLGLEVD